MQPQLVTAALVIKDKEILLLKRGNEPYKDYWGFPGGIGGWEKTSNPLEAVIEEVRGDVGCEFTGTFLTVNYSDNHKPTLTLFYIGSIAGEPTPVCKNAAEARYFPIQQARSMKLAFDHNEILEYTKQ